MNDRNRHGRSAKGAVGAILGLVTLALVIAAALARQRSRQGRAIPGDRQGSGVLDGADRHPGDFDMPEDMRAVIPQPPSYAPA